MWHCTLVQATDVGIPVNGPIDIYCDSGGVVESAPYQSQDCRRKTIWCVIIGFVRQRQQRIVALRRKMEELTPQMIDDEDNAIDRR